LRNNKKVLILEKECVGGQIAKSPKVENYPTHKSISGSQLANELFEQITELGCQFELENVSSLKKEDGIFNVTTDYNTYQAKSVIVATGSKPRTLDLEKEEEFIGKGVYYCAICDGPFFAGKEVTLIGDGNTALQYALTLSSYCSKVNLFTMFDKFFGEKVLEDKVRKADNISIRHNCKAVKLIGKDSLESVLFQNSGGILFEHQTDALFVAIGQVPDNKICEKLTPIDKNGYIISDETCLTATKGLFVAGDCRTKAVRQVTTAISDGAIAGTNANKYVELSLNK
ncbi:MAG: FAD-dependent oxidoreductase, partial [Clostridia bacterium]|nr:FAD-dependent oxidoreductase [Clostridia bacterium]